MRARHELNRSQCMSFPSRRKRYFSEKVMSQQAGEDHGSAISCVLNQGVHICLMVFNKELARENGLKSNFNILSLLPLLNQ